MDRTKSHLYKKKSAVTGVDKRVLRAHQKTVDQKTRRDEVVQKRRNVESVPAEKNVPKKDQAGLSRKEMLKKWKEGRELKKKLEAMDNSKKPGFKVKKVEHSDQQLYTKDKKKNAREAAKQKANNTTETDPLLRNGATKSTTGTRTAKPAPTSAMPAPSTRVTRNSAAAAKGKQVASALTTRTRTRGRDTKVKTEELPSIKKRTGKGSKAKEAKQSSDSSEVEEPVPAQCLFNANTIRLGRGEESASCRSGTDSESFAPADFTFSAPPNVKPIPFHPSPVSVAKFLSGESSSLSESDKEDETSKSKTPSRRTSRTSDLPAAEASFGPTSFYGNKENKTPKCPTPAANKKRRQSTRRSLAINTASTSETEEEMSVSLKGRRKSTRGQNKKKSDSETEKGNDKEEKESVDSGSNFEEASGNVEVSSRNKEKNSVIENMEISAPAHNVEKETVPEDEIEKDMPDELNTNTETCVMEDIEDTHQKPETLNALSTLKANDSGIVIDNFKTPVPLPRSNKKIRRSTAKTLAKLKSPEERLEVLSMSPMIEMSRRTPKIKSPEDQLKVIPPLPTFDDEDFEEPPPQLPSPEEPSDVPDDQPTTEESATSQTEDTAPATGSKEPEHDVKYFRDLLQSETERLKKLSAVWDEVTDKTPELSEDVKGQIRTTSGQAHLLIAQRFKQFRGLVDDCEFNTGMKPINCTDLQGFWDMVHFQVEDVNEKFDKLEKLKASGWVVEKPQVKKVIKKKTAPVANKPAARATARSKFAEFRAKMKTQKNEETKENTLKTPKKPDEPEEGNEDKTFEGGFFKVQSPVRIVEPNVKKTPKLPTNANTPAGRRSLIKTAVTNSTRKSLGVVPVMPKSIEKARRSLGVPSPLLPGCMAERPSPAQNTASPALPARALPPLRETTPKVPNESLQNKSSHNTPALEALKLDDSLSDGEKKIGSVRKTPARRSSTRKTEKVVKFASSSSASEMEVDEVDEDFISKYVMPTRPQSASKPEMMEVDAHDLSMKDEEMPGQMKRDLKDEFNKHSRSAQKKGPERSVGSVLKTTKKTPSVVRRRSVRFVESPGGHEDMAAPLPRTPYNRDGTVPMPRRRSSRLSSSSSSCSSRVSTPRPTKPWSEDLLVIDSPVATSETQQNISTLLFTPPGSTVAPSSGCNVDLISFTPEEETMQRTPKRRKVEPGRRKSTRLSSKCDISLL